MNINLLTENINLLTEHHWEFLRLKGYCTGSSESRLVKIPYCWKSYVTAHFQFYSISVPGMEEVIQQNLKAREKVMAACHRLPAHRARPAKDNKNCSHAPIHELVISNPSQSSTTPPLDIGARRLLPTRTGRSAKANKNSSHAPIHELVLPSPSETNTTPPYISFKEMMTRSHCKTNTDNSVRVGKIETPYRTCFTNKCPWR